LSGGECADDCDEATDDCYDPVGTVCTDDGNVCTTNQCDGLGVCGYIPSSLCGINGTVLYYRDGSTEPSTKEVPNVDIDMTEDGIADDTTDTTGSYTFPDLVGPYVEVTTLDKFGTSDISDHNGKISGLDVSRIAQHRVLLITLSSMQQIAADVTGNGSISGFDVSQVAQFTVELIDHFDVAEDTGSDWAFFRCDTYNSASDNTCGTPLYVHDPLSSVATDNFYAVLYGEVTGNWVKAGGLSPMTEEAQVAEADRRAAQALKARGRRPAPRRGLEPAVLWLTEAPGRVSEGEQWTVLVNARQPEGILGLDLELGYDPDRVSIVGIESRDAGSDFEVVSNDLGGSVLVTMYGVLPMEQSGSILAITVEAREDQFRQNTLTIRGEANEGQIPLEVHEGPQVRPRRPRTTR
jgi:hypothetical protein